MAGAPEFLDMLEGVRREGDGYTFDLRVDYTDDLIPLKWGGKLVNHSKAGGFSTYFAYRLPANFTGKDRMDLLRWIKANPDDPGVARLIAKAAMGLARNFPVGKLDAVVTPKSSSPLANMIAKAVHSRSAGHPALLLDLVAKGEASFDVDALTAKFPAHYTDAEREAATGASLRQFQSATKGGNLEIKKITPRLRSYVRGGFDVGGGRRERNAVAGEVLFVDDYRTSGWTLRSVNDVIKSAGGGAGNVTMFVLFSA